MRRARTLSRSFSFVNLRPMGLNLPALADGHRSVAEIQSLDLLWLGSTVIEKLVHRILSACAYFTSVSSEGTVWPFSMRDV